MEKGQSHRFAGRGGAPPVGPAQALRARPPIRFFSILYLDDPFPAPLEAAAEPDCFRDLHLDRIVAAALRGREEYRLETFFWLSLSNPEIVAWRQEIARDIKNRPIAAAIETFADSQRAMRHALEQFELRRHRLQKLRWFLDAVHTYCEGVARLEADLASLDLRSNGLRRFRAYLAAQVGSDQFAGLLDRTRRLSDEIEAIRYVVATEDGVVTVRDHDGEPDYGAQVASTFEKFRQTDARGFRFEFADMADATQVETRILERVEQLHPAPFAQLDAFARKEQGFADPLILRFDREVQFYLAYLDYVRPFEERGLRFCLPETSRKSKEILVETGFDLALAATMEGGALPVCNAISLTDPERILIVSGPNQGGKTTFARMFGQLHYLASLGLPVPAARARLFLCDRLFTHFEREEGAANAGGKLQDDIARLHAIMECATGDSIVVLNEIFTSTTLRDADRLSRALAARLISLELLCVWVTFLEELAGLGPQMVSMVSEVDPADPSIRTYRIERRPADGLAHALAIAAKYGLTRQRLEERLVR